MTSFNSAMLNAIRDRSECLVSLAEVQEKLAVMAQRINEELKDKNPIILCTMIGGVITTGLLLPQLSIDLQVDYIHATRYGNNTVGYDLEWRAYPRLSLENRCVVIVDDILDGGLTLAEIQKHCKQVGASEVYTAVLVDKAAKRTPGGLVKADFAALKVEDRFLYGLGLDYKGYFRNAPGIFAVAKEDETA
jgi:hypoxanthine phosphoribosyltransferase